MLKMFVRGDIDGDEIGWAHRGHYASLEDAVSDYGVANVRQVIPGVWTLHEDERGDWRVVAILVSETLA